MKYKTFSEIKTKIERELDLETEDFIQPEEFKEYVNDAISDTEAEIHKLGIEDQYYLSKTLLSLVASQADYETPDDLYENKIVRLVYSVGSTIYEIRRLRSQTRFEDRARINVYQTITDYYRYFIRNDGPGSQSSKPVVELIPPSRETVSNAVECWYIRVANKWEDDDAAFCDIPEVALQYLYAYVRYRCYDKEGHPNQQEAKDMMDKKRMLMVDTLTNMVPDEDSEMDKDLSIYQDFT